MILKIMQGIYSTLDIGNFLAQLREINLNTNCSVSG